MTTGSSGQGQDLYRDLISAAECAEIVRNSLPLQNPRVVEYSFTKIPGHIGFLGEYLHLEVIVESDGHRSTQRYFVKSLPLGDKNQRAMIEELGFFLKEVRVYSKILAGFVRHRGQSQQWHPECYFTRDDLIVLEDLKWRQGFSMVNYKTALGQPFLHLVLDRVAQMHADSLDYEFRVAAGKRLDEMFPDVLFEASVQRNNGWFMAGLSGIKAIALHGTKYAEDAEKKQIMETELENKLHRVFDIAKPTSRFQNVLVHRDIWLNNIMFQFEKDPVTGEDIPDAPKACILLDFQICRYLPPMVDVLLTLYLTTRRSNRNELFDHYLKFYYERLTDKLKEFNLEAQQVLSWEQLKASMVEYKLMAHVFAGVYLALTNLPANVLDDLHRDDPELYHHYCNENRDEFMLRYLREDEFYRDTMTECVEETLEYLFGFGDDSKN